MKGILICTMNNKGGVGKTTLSCNLGAALARMNKRILIVDNDSQCNSTGILLKETNITNTLHEFLDPDTKIDVGSCVYQTTQKNLYCIPNVRETSGLEMELIKLYPDSQYILKNELRSYAIENFDFTIIDTPPNIGLFVYSSLLCSDFVIVPINAGSAYSLDGLNEALDHITAIREDGNPELRFLRLLINFVDKRTSICNITVEDIYNKYENDQVFKTIIPVNTTIQQAEYSKKTIFDYDQSSKGARAFRTLGKELLDILENQDGTKNTGSKT